MPLSTYTPKPETGAFIGAESIQKAVAHAAEFGGATIFRSNRFKPRNVGRFIVADHNDDFAFTVEPGMRLTVAQLEYVITARLDAIELPFVGVGLWYDEGTLHVEPVICFKSLHDALKAAEALGEREIWDRTAQQTIKVQ